jgi:hypothetical protein
VWLQVVDWLLLAAQSAALFGIFYLNILNAHVQT